MWLFMSYVSSGGSVMTTLSSWKGATAVVSSLEHKITCETSSLPYDTYVMTASSSTLKCMHADVMHTPIIVCT